MAVTTYTLLKKIQHGDYIQKTLQENEDAFLTLYSFTLIK